MADNFRQQRSQSWNIIKWEWTIPNSEW